MDPSGTEWLSLPDERCNFAVQGNSPSRTCSKTRNSTDGNWTRRAYERGHDTKPRVSILTSAPRHFEDTSLSQQVWSSTSHSFALLLVISLLYTNNFQGPGGLFITFTMTSGTVSSLLVLFLSCTSVLAQTANTQSVQYNQVLNVNGDVSTSSIQ